MDKIFEKPEPKITEQTRSYWDAARKGALVLPRCGSCNRYHFYPRSTCPHCGSDELSWQPCCGTGKVYSFTVVERPPSPAFAGDVPYAIVVVRLDEGPHMMSKVIDCAPEAISVGMSLEAAFEVRGESVLPVFRPRTV